MRQRRKQNRTDEITTPTKRFKFGEEPEENPKQNEIDSNPGPNVTETSLKCHSNVTETSPERHLNVTETSPEKTESDESQDKRHPNVTETFSSVTETSLKCHPNVTETSPKRHQKNEKNTPDFAPSKLTEFHINIGLYLLNIYISDNNTNTGKVKTSLMIKNLNTTRESLRTALWKMNTSGCFKTVIAKRHHREFHLSDDFFYYINRVQKLESEVAVSLKRHPNVTETSPKCHPNVTETSPHPSLSHSSSSSDLKSGEEGGRFQQSLKTTTTELPDEWKKITIPDLLLEEHSMHDVVQQVYNKKYSTPEITQDSLNYIDYDIRINNSAKAWYKPVKNVFMGAMKNNGLYSRPQNYISETDQKMSDYLRQKEEDNKAKQESEKKLQSTLLEEWILENTQEAIEKVVPSGEYEYRGSFHMDALTKYFIANEYQQRKTNLLKLVDTEDIPIPNPIPMSSNQEGFVSDDLPF